MAHHPRRRREGDGPERPHKRLPPRRSGEILKHFQKIVGGRDAVVVECGACDGYHTAAMYQIGFRAAKTYRHIALEPNARLVRAFKARATLPDVTLVEAAISDSVGNADFWLSSGGNKQTSYFGSSSLQRPTGVLKNYPDMRFDAKEKVRTTTLDALCAEYHLDHVDFIWADIQGGEKRMLRGGLSRCLPRTRYLYTEYSNGGLYEDDATLDDIVALLPGWRVAHDFCGDFFGDVLMANERFAEGT